MKIFAFMLIMLSAFCFGFEILKPQRNRIEMLNSLCKFLELMHAELSCRPCPMVELFEMLSKIDLGQAKVFFQILAANMNRLGLDSFDSIWEEAVDYLRALSTEQLSIVKSLGTILGRYELSEQLGAINNCRAKLVNELDRLKCSYPMNRKLCIALPCSLGAILVIVLV